LGRFSRTRKRICNESNHLAVAHYSPIVVSAERWDIRPKHASQSTALIVRAVTPATTPTPQGARNECTTSQAHLAGTARI